MVDFSVIKDEKLRKLMQNSARFRALPEEKQQDHLNKIKDLPEDRQKAVCDFFEHESVPPKKLTSEEQLEILTKLYDEVVALEKKFTKLLEKEPENKQKEQEEQKMGNLIDKLDNI